MQQEVEKPFDSTDLLFRLNYFCFSYLCSSVLPQAVVRQGAVAARSLMKITLSSDHRVVDGAMAARFVNKVRSLIEDLEAWKNMI